MKKIFKKITALSLGLALVAAGCSKDNKDNLAKEIAGSYVGTVSISGATVAPDVTINVTAKNENTATLSLDTTLPGVLSGIDLPLNVTCDATVAKDGSNYKVDGNTTVTIEQLGGQPLSVSISGTVTPAGQATLTISITVVVPLAVVFEGTRQ
jgi:hypothetical protein